MESYSNMSAQAKIFILLDMLGDMHRSGPICWHVKREILEDIKDHVFDIIAMDTILKYSLPSNINHERIVELALIHDMEEAMTGDIIAFEGVPKEEKERVNKMAIDYIVACFNMVMPFDKLFNEYEGQTTIEAKLCHIYDKVQSIIPFVKYDNEELIDMDNPKIMKTLRELPLIVEGKKQGKILSELFYDYHIKSVSITQEEASKYGIPYSEAKSIMAVIKSFIDWVVIEFKHKDEFIKSFPEGVNQYKRD